MVVVVGVNGGTNKTAEGAGAERRKVWETGVSG